MEREEDNPDFNFLFKQGFPENIYYRWKVYSLAQGDSQDYWRQSPFQFCLGGSIWHPPQIIKDDKEDEIVNIKEKTLKHKNKILSPKIQNRSNENFNSNDEDEESEEVYNLHVGLVKLDQYKLNKFTKILEYLTIKR